MTISNKEKEPCGSPQRLFLLVISAVVSGKQHKAEISRYAAESENRAYHKPLPYACSCEQHGYSELLEAQNKLCHVKAYYRNDKAEPYRYTYFLSHFSTPFRPYGLTETISGISECLPIN